MQNDFHGACLCGGITFSVNGFSTEVANCHCTMCRKFHGAAFGTLVSVYGLKWLSGTELIKEFIAANGTTRTFCRECGSSISFLSKGANASEIEMAIALFDTDIPVKVDAQIFTQNKANWCELLTGIPTFKKARSQ